jgi:hypothetical protein
MKPIYYLLFLTCSFAVISCSKDDNSDPDNNGSSDNKPHVYICGHESAGTNKIAKYWKDSVEVALTDGTHDANAYAIFVDGKDVYVVGDELDGTHRVAKYWKNGVAVNLTDGQYNATAKDISVSGNDVYVTGSVQDGTSSYYGGVYVAKYWKNGKAISLSDGLNDASADAILVSNNMVYIAGTVFEPTYSNNIAVYWANDKIKQLLTPNGTNQGSGANDIVRTDNGNFVVAGSTHKGNTNLATCWKDEQQVNLTDGKIGTNLESVYPSGTDLYFAGWRYKSEGDYTMIANYWKNGTETVLNDGTKDAEAYAICVSNSVVHVVGWEDGNYKREAQYWVNGVAKRICKSQRWSEATDIVIK